MFQIVPSIDLRSGKVVRLVQGDYARQIDYDLDPIQTARKFESAGAKWMHIVDLDGAKNGHVAQLELIAQIAGCCGIDVQVGGGVRSTDDVDRLIDAGASRVVVGTRAMEHWGWFEHLAHEPKYSDRLVLALDARDGKVATRGWTQTTDQLAVDVAQEVRGWKGLAGILYTDVARDGMLGGSNLHYTKELAQATDVPVIASGGVGTLDDIRMLSTLHIWGVIIGRSLHDGRVDLAQAVRMVSPV